MTSTLQSRAKGGDKSRRSDRTRGAILAAAEKVFARAGLAGARTEAIAAEAGVNKAMLFYYFKTKDDLYEAVLEDHFARFNEQGLAILNGEGTAREVLLRYVNLQFDFISERRRFAPLFQQLMMASGGTDGGKSLERLVRKYIGPRAEALHRLLVRGMKSGEFRKADPMHTAVSITALIVFYFSAAPVLQSLALADAYTPANLKRRKQEVLEFIRHGLFLDVE